MTGKKITITFLSAFLFLGFAVYPTSEVAAQASPSQEVDNTRNPSVPKVLDQDESLGEVQEQGIPRMKRGRRAPQAGQLKKSLPIDQVVPLNKKAHGIMPEATVNPANSVVTVNPSDNQELNRIKGILKDVDKNLNKIPKKSTK